MSKRTAQPTVEDRVLAAYTKRRHRTAQTQRGLETSCVFTGFSWLVFFCRGFVSQFRAFSTHYLIAACRDMRLPVATDLGIWQLKPFSFCKPGNHTYTHKNDSPYSITERRVPELIPVLGSQPAGDVSHKPGGRLPLLSARPAVTPAIINRAATNFAAW